MNVTPNDIIAAVATPPGRSALAMVRISGAGSVALAAGMIEALGKVDPKQSRTILYDFLLDDDGQPLDEVTAIPYFSPKSYTAEEMVEIICHGGFAAARTILDRLIKCGARLAEPGEFTRRAFINGRISLSQAEAVAAAIEAKSELALKAAARNLRGELYAKIDSIRIELRDLLSLIEAEIDFSDDEIDKTPMETVASTILEQFEIAGGILKSYDFGRGLNQGYRIAIVGRANVGKSSLMNALLKRERAIVTDIPGTTRDTLTEWIEIDGFPVLLTDTAGLRDSGDTVEKIGQERTKKEIDESDLVLVMLDSSTGITDEDLAIFKAIENKRIFTVVNKSDLKPECDLSRLPTTETMSISALKGAGLDDLKSRIGKMLSIDDFSLDTALLATERQHDAMGKVCRALSDALTEMESGATEEVLAAFIRETLDYLGELVGETTNDDILNNIFDRFCIGK